ncbi:hypothetical protein M407DRAFT_243150 [Tulasnella calospora MUT 4182]|uniref:Phosphatidic acid phosphatase type 2/haloperoxidase domain-containing protein n=1 Tax=Tulasnella calospora MUT 4182 TaxID=1051891 RepID=A0A0C3QL18_9AGAM|nr:hypothetical protein M407DRAFT_243150 [Tulasnella calospora MUT 4182]
MTGDKLNPVPRDGSKRPPLSSRRRWKLLISYAPDWIITIGATGLFYLLDGIHGFWRDFSLTDTSIQYNYTLHERVPNWALYLIALIAPLVIMPIINIISIRSWWDWHNSWLGLILSVGLTGTITNIVKITAGRPRPDLISRCQPGRNADNALIFGLADASICTQTDIKILRDGFRSFFSGHSSLSFAGLGFLFWYMSGKMHLFDLRGHAGKAWIAFVPLMGATLVAISRTMDYRHHPIDVFVGAVVGLVISHYSYRQYFPPLTHPLCHRPYSPRIPRESEEDGQLAGANAVPTSSTVGPSANTGSPGPDDTVQRNNQDVSDAWREGSRRGVAGMRNDEETVVRAR